MARPAVFDRHVLALDVAGVFEALAKSAQAIRQRVRRPAVEQPDHRHRRLLRPRCQRPGDCRAAEQRDELAPRYVEHGGVLPRFVPTKRTQGITGRTAGPWATPEMF